MNIRDIIHVFLENCLSEFNKPFTIVFVIVHSWCSTVGIFAFFCLSRVVWFVGAIWTPELTHIYKLVYISRYFFDPGCGCKIIKEWMTAFSPKWDSYSAKIFWLLYTWKLFKHESGQPWQCLVTYLKAKIHVQLQQLKNIWF